MLVTATLWIIWWFVLSDKGYLRHLWNAFILFLVSGGILVAAKHQHVVEELYRLYRGKACALILISTLYLISLLGLGMAARYAHNSSHTSLDTQISGSKQIATYLGNQPLYNFGWWQNPDVQFLLQKSSQPLDESEGAQGWVIMESIYKRLLPQDYKVQLAKCSKTIVISNEYTLCWHGGNK